MSVICSDLEAYLKHIVAAFMLDHSEYGNPFDVVFLFHQRRHTE